MLEVITVPVNDTQMMTVKAEQFIVKEYKLWIEKAIDFQLTAGSDEIQAAKRYLRRSLAKELEPYITVSVPFNRGLISCRMRAEVNLPYIHDKVLQEKDDRIRHLKEVNSSYFAQVFQLHILIAALELPWYTKLGDWLSAP